MYFVFVGQNALQVSVRSIVLECCSNVLLLLIFFILSIIESGVLKAPAVTVDYLFLIPVLSGFFFSFMFSRICCQMNPLLFSHSVVSDSLRTQGLSPARLVRCIYFYNFYVFLMDWPFVIVKYPPQSLIISSVLESILSDDSIATQLSFWLLFAWYIFSILNFHPI